MKMRSVLPMRIAKYGYIVVSVVFCLVGLAMIFFPAPSLSVIGKFMGIAMILFGIVKLIGYFSRDLFRLAFQYDLEFGALLILLGIVTLVKPGNIMSFLCVSLGICFIAESLFKIKIALEAKTFGIRTWWTTALFAALAAIAGLLLFCRPSEAVQTMIVILGCALLAEGIMNLSVAISLVKIVKHQMPDVVEGEFTEIKEDK